MGAGGAIKHPGSSSCYLWPVSLILFTHAVPDRQLSVKIVYPSHLPLLPPTQPEGRPKPNTTGSIILFYEDSYRANVNFIDSPQSNVRLSAKPGLK